MKRRKTKEERDAQKEQLQTILSNAHESVWYELSKLTEFLQFAAKFPRYSYNNQLLIFAQKPSATAVKSFNAWKEAGRFVKKGEKGIEIFAPIQKTYVRKENEVDDNGNPKLDDEGQPIKKKVCIEYLDYTVKYVSTLHKQKALRSRNWTVFQKTLCLKQMMICMQLFLDAIPLSYPHPLTK